MTKLFLAKRSIRGSTYPTITSSFFVQSIFDTSVGILVLLYAITQGLLPKPPEQRSNDVVKKGDIAPWPYWPMILRTSSAHEEGEVRTHQHRDWSINTKYFKGDEQANVKKLGGVVRLGGTKRRSSAAHNRNTALGEIDR